MTYPTKKLGEVCEVVGGGTPSTAVSEYWNGGKRLSRSPHTDALVYGGEVLGGISPARNY